MCLGSSQCPDEKALHWRRQSHFETIKWPRHDVGYYSALFERPIIIPIGHSGSGNRAGRTLIESIVRLLLLLPVPPSQSLTAPAPSISGGNTPAQTYVHTGATGKPLPPAHPPKQRERGFHDVLDV